jgi:hypothetical protein
MKDIPLEDMTKERLLVEYKHYVNATELKEKAFIEYLKSEIAIMPTATASEYVRGQVDMARLAILKAKEML